MGRAGSDQHAFAFKRLRCAGAEQFLDRGGDLQRLGHAPHAAFARFRHLAFIRADERDAVGDKLREIALHRLVRPHVRVHRRCEKYLRAGCQQHRGGEIVSVAAGKFRHQVGGGRRHHDQIGFARQPNMADVELSRWIEQIGEHALADNGAGRQRRDEMLGGFGQDATHG